VLDSSGIWVYLQDMQEQENGELIPGPFWSAGMQPVPASTADLQVTFFPHMAVLRRTENEVTSTMEVTVGPDDPVEVRRIHLHNASPGTHHLRITSYGEVILTPQALDRRHPAFNKLFIESEFVPELNLQIFWRRPRSTDEKHIYMGHMLLVNPKERADGASPHTRHEADRNLFIGRGRTLQNPLALASQEYLTGTSGATLDPIFSLGCEIRLDGHENSSLAYLTIAGESREEIIALARRYTSWSLIERSFHQSNMTAQAWMGKQDYDTQAFKDTLQVLSSLVYPFMPARTSHEVIAKNKLSQSGLWRFGISGDYPILLIELGDPQQLELVREALRIHEFLRIRRFSLDVVILNQQHTNYGAELNGMLYRLINRMNSEQWLTKRGGIFILYADQITPDELTLLETAAGMILRGERGELAAQVPDYTNQVPHLPGLMPSRPIADPASLQPDPLPATEPLQFHNGYGGFSQGGREYIIDLPPGKHTPAPWVNIIGYPYFGSPPGPMTRCATRPAKPFTCAMRRPAKSGLPRLSQPGQTSLIV
jgi:cellobiose phosphorylase